MTYKLILVVTIGCEVVKYWGVWMIIYILNQVEGISLSSFPKDETFSDSVI